MQHLKQDFKSRLEDKILAAKKEINQYEQALKALEAIDMENATYSVTLVSLLADEGERSVDVWNTGPIKDAISLAERQFKRTNKRSDVQAGYYVQMHVGGFAYDIPEEYWKKYAERH